MPDFGTFSITEHMRAQKDAYRADYDAARPSRFKRRRAGVSSTGRDADWHLRNEADYYLIMELVRDMHTNDAVLGQLTERAVSLHLPQPLTVDFKTSDEALNKALGAEHWDWWGDKDAFDIARQMDGPTAEKMAMRSAFRDGDFHGLSLETLHNQFFEGHRIRTSPRNVRPNVHLGVEVNDYLQRIRYTVLSSGADRVGKSAKSETPYHFDAFDADGVQQWFHAAFLRRSSKTRGDTAYHPIVDMAGMFDDVNFALLVKQQLAAFLAMSIEQSDSSKPNEPVRVGQTETAIGAKPNSTMPSVIDQMKAGSILQPKSGQTVKMLSSNIPSTEQLAHMRLLLQLIGLNLELPLVAVLLDSRETNFSGWRGSINCAEPGWISKVEELILNWHRPMTKRWTLKRVDGDDALGKMLRSHLAKGNSPRDLTRHEWTRSPVKSIQPLQDASAKAVRVATLQASPRRIAAEDGKDFEDIVTEAVEDMGMAIEKAALKAKALKETHGIDVTWRDVLNRDLPAGMKVAVSSGDEQQNNQPGNAGGGSNNA